MLCFTGEWHDTATGLHYLRARWYHPQTGRFTLIFKTIKNQQIIANCKKDESACSTMEAG
ncbi:MAG: hypothetical protein JXA33_29155 [Anaerolineae bacterium]|nr:hypothetical protein [Anaerolineae bacterium]